MESAKIQRGELAEGKMCEQLTKYCQHPIQNLITSVQRLTPSTIEFDLVGVDASIANALRRVMIAEVSCGLRGYYGCSEAPPADCGKYPIRYLRSLSKKYTCGTIHQLCRMKFYVTELD